jgi:hypothetical protein
VTLLLLPELIQEDLEAMLWPGEFDPVVWAANYRSCTERLKNEARTYKKIIQESQRDREIATEDVR